MSVLKIELVKEFSFNALHRLPYAPAGDRSTRPHEHSFRVDVTVEGEVKPREQTGELVDYGDIEQAMDPLLENYLENGYLNQIDGLENPTSENIARWIWGQLKNRLPGLKRVALQETCTSSCHYEGQ